MPQALLSAYLMTQNSKSPATVQHVAVGSKLTLGMRPEDLIIDGAAGAQFNGKALVVERLGGETYTYAQLDDKTLITVKSDRTALTSAGKAVPIRCQCSKLPSVQRRWPSH